MNKPKKKKLTKRERDKLKEEQAKQQARELEAARQRQIAEKKRKAAEEKRLAKLKRETELANHAIRTKTLVNSCKLFAQMKESKTQQDIACRDQIEWQHFINNDGLPFPSNISAMNTYLYLWKLETDCYTIDHAERRALEVLKLLDYLNEVIDIPLDKPPLTVEMWKSVRSDFREELQSRIDKATYLILRNLEENMIHIDLETVKYLKQCSAFILSLWSVLKLPRSSNDDRPSPTIDFPDCGVNIQLPPQFSQSFIAVRTLWLKYNHFSDLSRSWNKPQVSFDEEDDLFEFTNKKWEETEKIRKEIEEEEIKQEIERQKLLFVKKKSKHQPPSSEASDSLKTFRLSDKTFSKDILLADIEKLAESQSPMNDGSENEFDLTKSAPKSGEQSPSSEKAAQLDLANVDSLSKGLDSPPSEANDDVKEIEYPASPVSQRAKSPNQIWAEKEEMKAERLREALTLELDEKEINLRRYVVLGGVFHLDLLQQPSQAQQLANKCYLTLLTGPQNIQPINYLELYEPPAPSQDALLQTKTSSEEEEHEAKTKKEGLEKLVTISIVLPDNILWFEPPTVVQWDDQHKYWSTQYIFDQKFNEEKQVVVFRAGRMRPFGLATFRFSNLPYQTWEIRPGPGSTISFSITAAIIIVEFLVKNDEICLNQLQNATSTALQELVGIFYKPHKLMKLLREGGVDLFPPDDAFLYLENARNKHQITENHVYHCMALLATTHMFSWSRWNLLAAHENIVFQIKELARQTKQKLTNYQMLLVTPWCARLVVCTEVSQAFMEEGIEGMSFYADLYNLVMDYGLEETKESIKEVSVTLAQTLFYLLRKTRILTFS
nr:PREDICTED: protein CASC1-like [Bemisia tabaci]